MFFLFPQIDNSSGCSNKNILSCVTWGNAVVFSPSVCQILIIIVSLHTIFVELAWQKFSTRHLVFNVEIVLFKEPVKIEWSVTFYLLTMFFAFFLEWTCAVYGCSHIYPSIQFLIVFDLWLFMKRYGLWSDITDRLWLTNQNRDLC